MQIMTTFKQVTAMMIFALVIWAGGGCNILGPVLYATHADQTRKVPAEYTGLEGKRMCVWVWADDAVSFDYPAIRIDVANYVKYAISQKIECEFVDPETVDKFQRSNYEADRLSVVEVGKRFKADVVLFIEIHEFRTHPRTMPNLLQGHILAQCALYDCTGELPAESRKRRLWNGSIDVKYPERIPLNVAQSNERSVRATTLQIFGDALAKKFYTHRERIGD